MIRDIYRRMRVATRGLLWATALALACGVAVPMYSQNAQAENSLADNAQAASVSPDVTSGEWIRDQHGCKLWDPNPKPGESVAWSGKCVAGYGGGNGVERWMNASSGWEQSDRLTLKRGRSFGAELECSTASCLEYYETSDVAVGTYTYWNFKGKQPQVEFKACSTLYVLTHVCSGRTETVYYGSDGGAYETGSADNSGQLIGAGLNCGFSPLKCAEVTYKHGPYEWNGKFGINRTQIDAASGLPRSALAQVRVQAFVNDVGTGDVRGALESMAYWRDVMGPAEPPAVAIVEAQLAHRAGFDLRAMYVLTLYFRTQSPSDSQYQKAVDLYAQLKEEISALQQPSAAGSSASNSATSDLLHELQQGGVGNSPSREDSSALPSGRSNPLKELHQGGIDTGLSGSSGSGSSGINIQQLQSSIAKWDQEQAAAKAQANQQQSVSQAEPEGSGSGGDCNSVLMASERNNCHIPNNGSICDTARAAESCFEDAANAGANVCPASVISKMRQEAKAAAQTANSVCAGGAR